ncbi:catechol 2,3-dioxygenase-like lactoylglutathione lyase family enzyme [Bradyrhizobium japonicum]
MSQELAAPVPRLTVITLGVSDIRASIAFYDALGFARRLKATGEVVAFYDTGGPVLALFHWDKLAADAKLPDNLRPATFRGITLAGTAPRATRSMRFWPSPSARAPRC